MMEQYHDPWLDPLEPCVLCRSKIIKIGTLYTGDNSDTILLCIHKLAHIYLLANMLSIVTSFAIYICLKMLV